MNYNVVASGHFDRKLKQLKKKFPNIRADLMRLIESLEVDPRQGRSLGSNIYKVRMALSDKGKGKSGGARVITYTVDEYKRVTLLTIYNKSETGSISAKEIMSLLKNLD